jgi:hypothetical protein
VASRPSSPRSSADLIAGLVFVAFGLAFAVAAARYDRGSLLNMGPGYVPLLLGGLLVALGAAVGVKAYVSPDMSHLDRAGADHDGDGSDGDGSDGPEDAESAARRARDADGLSFEAVAWRPLVLVSAAILLFTMTIDGLGLLPATFGAAVVACFAARDITVVRAVLTAVGLTVVSLVIFVVLLQLRLPLVGDWLGG